MLLRFPCQSELQLSLVYWPGKADEEDTEKYLSAIDCLFYFREVGYHIRYEKNIVPKTEIKFMTDGILLQEIKKVVY